MARRKGTMVYLTDKEKAELDRLSTDDDCSYSDMLRGLVRKEVIERYTVITIHTPKPKKAKKQEATA